MLNMHLAVMRRKEELAKAAAGASAAAAAAAAGAPSVAGAGAGAVVGGGGVAASAGGPAPGAPTIVRVPMSVFAPSEGAHDGEAGSSTTGAPPCVVVPTSNGPAGPAEPVAGGVVAVVPDAGASIDADAPMEPASAATAPADVDMAATPGPVAPAAPVAPVAKAAGDTAQAAVKSVTAAAVVAPQTNGEGSVKHETSTAVRTTDA